MMPSRGLHLLRARAPQVAKHQYRNLSSIPRPSIRTRHVLASNRTPWTASLPTTTSIACAVRYASTAPVQPTAASAQSPPDSFPNLDTITLDNIDLNTTVDIANLPEKIGYLNQIGLDYGWGPTSILQWTIEHMHITFGLPWWGSILATGMILRLVMLPLFLKSSDTMARQQALTPILNPIMQKVSQFRKEGRQQEMTLALQQYMAIRKQAGIRVADTFIPLGLQGVFGYCGFKLLHAMATLPVPGLKDGGFLWLTDLTVNDGFLVLPTVMALAIHGISRLGGETGAGGELPPGMKNILLYGMPVILFAVTAFQPGAVCVWFCGTGAIGMSQALLLRNESARKFFNLAPMYKPTAEERKGSLFSQWLGEEEPAASSPSRGGAANQQRGPVMKPSYQAPTQSGRTIDVSLVNKAGQPSPSDMVQPDQSNSGKGGVFQQASDAYQKFKKRAAVAKEEQLREAEKRAKKRRADEYEEKAQRRGR